MIEKVDWVPQGASSGEAWAEWKSSSAQCRHRWQEQVTGKKGDMQFMIMIMIVIDDKKNFIDKNQSLERKVIFSDAIAPNSTIR